MYGKLRMTRNRSIHYGSDHIYYQISQRFPNVYYVNQEGSLLLKRIFVKRLRKALKPKLHMEKAAVYFYTPYKICTNGSIFSSIRVLAVTSEGPRNRDEAKEIFNIMSSTLTELGKELKEQRGDQAPMWKNRLGQKPGSSPHDIWI